MHDRSASSRIIVIGGGIVGLCAAYELARRGSAVTVIERDQLGVGASSGNAGLIAAGHPPIPKPGVVKQTLKWMFDSSSPLYIPPRFKPTLIRWMWEFNKACNDAFFRRSMKILAMLGHETMNCFERILQDESIGTQAEYHAHGQIEVFKQTQTRDHLREEAELLRSHGFEVEELDADELHRREPAYVDDVIGAMILRDSAFADPGKLTLAMAECARRHGAEIVSECEVREIATDDGSFKMVRTQDGREFEGDALVLAGGIWTTGLAKKLGINVPMQAAKGYHVNLTAPPVNINLAGVLKETFVAVNPMNGGLRLAGTLEFSGLDDRVMRNRVEMLLTGAKKYIRDLDQTERLSEWFGYRPCTADGLPVIGFAPQYRNVVIATGHAMMGFALGPVTGRLVSELLLDGRPSLEIDALSVDRFTQRR